MRKYCQQKLSESIRPMFVEYKTALKVEGSSEPSSSGEVNLTDEETSEIDQQTASFVTELESCMMDEYAEPDKHGRPSAGLRYK